MALRKILFRGKRLDNNEWVEGDLCRSIQDGKFCIMPVAFFATRDLGCEDKDENPIISDSMAIGGFYPVITETIDEFTSLVDSNGVNLFEGDIIRSFDSKGKQIMHTVVFEKEESRFALMIENASQWDTPMRLTQRWINEFDKQIIGNVHDNQLPLF